MDFDLFVLFCNVALILGTFVLGFIIAILGLSFRPQRPPSVDGKVLAFFHPYCDGGGGGERVLWVLIAALFNMKAKSKFRIIIYSCKDESHKMAILQDVKNRFGIDLIDHAASLRLIKIHSVPLLEARWYPIATMLFQSLGSVFVGLECLYRYQPDVFCDTMGAAFTYPLAKRIAGLDVIAYVHYPIISSDMLQKVREQRPSYNNDANIAGNVTISSIKLIYYQWFARLYSWVGSYADKVFVNSSWTEKHISQLWGLDIDENIHLDNLQTTSSPSSPSMTDSHPHPPSKSKSLVKLYPPCNTTHLQNIPLGNMGSKTSGGPSSSPSGRGSPIRVRAVLSIGQFRPEKDHSLQLRAFKALREIDDRFHDVWLVIVGSTRNAQDEAMVTSLRDEAINLGISACVDFVVNAPYSQLHSWLSRAAVGLHTMWNEHFGISIVEMMAAGLVIVAHNSGGPLTDVVRPAHPSTPHLTSSTTSLKKESKGRVPGDSITGDSSGGGGTGEVNDPGAEVDNNTSPEDNSTGYLATTPSEYAQCMATVLDRYQNDASGLQQLRIRARESVKTFSDEVFQTSIQREFAAFL